MGDNTSQLNSAIDSQDNLENDSDTLESLQGKSLSFVLISTSIAALPTLFSSVLTAIEDRLWFNLAAYPTAYIVCLIITFYKKVPLKVRAWIAVLIYFALGILGMYTAGLAGSGRILLFTSAILATLTLGISSGIIILVAQLGVVFYFSYLMISGRFSSPATTAHNTSLVITTSFTFLFLSVVSIVAMALVIRGLSQTLERYRKNRDELSALSERLQQSLASLQESEERWSFALEGAGDGVWDWDILADQIYYSPRWKQMLGYKDSEIGVSPKEWRSRVHPEDYSEVEKSISLFESQSNVQSRFRIQCRDGSYKWILARGKVIDRGVSGNPLRLIGTIADISLIKQLEEQQIAYEARLQQTYKMEAIGTLAGGIAHDFNNILGSIIGYSQMARRHSDQESKQYKYLEQILVAGNRAKELVQQILAFSRHSEKRHIVIDLVPLIKETIKMLRPSLPSTISIKLNLQTSKAPTVADPTEFNQILMNLCTNAFHAMEKDGGTLDITLEEYSVASDQRKNLDLVEGHYLLLSVADSGVGIPAPIRDRIFEPYFTTKEQGKGTGMGLSIVHGIMSGYGGTVTCSSEVGSGTCFNLYFPQSRGIDSNDRFDDHEVMIVPGTESILFVDDEVQICNMVKEMLENYGYSVTIMDDSTQAYEVFQLAPESFDLVVTDQTMPQLTGVELAQKILRVRPDMPIILCSGYSSIVTEQDVFKAGIRRYLLKPLATEKLAMEIRSVLDEN